MTNIQEMHDISGIDYRRGSPHLTHLSLYDRLVEVLRGMVQRLEGQGLPCGYSKSAQGMADLPNPR